MSPILLWDLGVSHLPEAGNSAWNLWTLSREQEEHGEINFFLCRLLTKLLSFQSGEAQTALVGEEVLEGEWITEGWWITASCQAQVPTAQQSSQTRAFSPFPSSHLLPLHGEQERVNPVTFNQGLVYMGKD